MTVSSDLVGRVVARLFGPDEIDLVLQALSACTADAPSGERDRVQLAVLKLCDEDPSRNLHTWSLAAKKDYRDVLFWAESPGEAKTGGNARLSPAELKALRVADRGQLAAWRNSVA